MDHLVNRFRAARLKLRLLGEPIRAANRDIFQMDIVRLRSDEQFRLWKGHADNRIEVPSVDRKIRQLVLVVQEAARSFTVRLPKSQFTHADAQRAATRAGGWVVNEPGRTWVIQRSTSPAPRRYLCGRDEKHLFIAQFARGASVRHAHAALKPPAVVDAERSAPRRTLRQGEWFLVPLSRSELLRLKAHIRSAPHAVRRREALSGGGRPHVAEETVVTERGRRYVRGYLRHSDHRLIVLREWHQVVRNAEITEAAGGRNGIFWID